MPKPLSNPTTRVLQVLEHLTTRPLETYGLSELARNIGISKSTCLSILNTLVEAGYVVQHPVQRYYSLGPAAIAVGQAALVRFPDVSDVLPVLRQLAQQFGMTATVEAVAGDQLLVVASEGRGDPMRGIARTGVRVRFAPPYGAPLAATADAGTLKSYLDRAGPPLSQDKIRDMLRSFEVGRRRGYFVGLGLPHDHPLHDRLTDAWEARSPDRELEPLVPARQAADYLLDEIEDARRYTVSVIGAPVMPRHRSTEIALALLAFDWNATGAEIRALGERLAAAAADVAERRGGDSSPR
jgi:DNA-binding IclR family transcriptional regulator